MAVVSVSFAALAFALAAVPQDPPLRPSARTLKVTGATVFTGTGKPWRGDSLEVRGGKFVPSGFVNPVREGGMLVELADAFVVPGLQDAHGHLRGLGDALAEVNLVGTKSLADVIERTAAAASKVPKGEWVLGRGWDQNDWPEGERSMPHHGALSAATPDHPVWLVRVDGHAGVLNTRGMQASGITKASVAPDGGEILFDERGEPTGVLVDKAMVAVAEPRLSVSVLRQRLIAAHDECLRHGLTCVHDAGVSQAELEQMVALHAEGKWHLRTYVLLAATERELIMRGPWRTPDGLIVVRAVKGYADGALGSRGAVLLEPYSDRASWKGLMLTTKAGLQELAQLCADHRMQLCVHAIGDAANRAVLDAYAAVKLEGGIAPLRFRIEHAQVIAGEDFTRFRDLGVLPSMQPTHLTSDMPWAPERLGADRVRRAYAWRLFHQVGVIVPFGSDFPVESVDPRRGLFAAVTTRGEHGGPDEGYRPDQKLSREDALRGFTLHAAYGMHAENELGTIEPSKLADFTVFDRNLLTCGEAELLQARVLLTVVNGRVVWDGRGK